jgi:hypothetical protein
MYDIHACHPGSMCDLHIQRQSLTTWQAWERIYASNSFSLKSTHLVRTASS